MSDETIRETGAITPPTYREGRGTASTMSNATLREGAAATDGDIGWSPLPPSVAQHYTFVAPLATRGSEASLYLVTSVATGEQLVLKLYRPGIELRREALERLATISTDHVVRLYFWDVAPEIDQWYEVQEHVRGGTLIDLLETSGVAGDSGARHLTAEMLDVVVREMNDALHALHEQQLFHHDVKPENVLVRNVDPLDLVLSDFGLAAVSTDDVVLSSRRDGTPHYLAPEVMAKKGGASRDYWALGMTIAFLAGGRHPFGDLSEHAILDHLHRKLPIDLSAVTDPRVSALCRGLLLYDLEHRWKAAEVTACLAGESPPIREDITASGRLVAGYEFEGVVYDDPVALASALADDWTEAARLVGAEANRKLLLRSLEESFLSNHVADVIDQWNREAPSPDRAVAEVVIALDPHLSPLRFRGFAVDGPHLGDLAREAVGSDGEARWAVVALLQHRVLELYAGVAGDEDLGAIDAQWRASVDEYTATFESVASEATVPAAETRDLASARLLLACTVPAAADRLSSDAARVATSDAREQAWFNDLVKSPDTWARALVVLAVAEPAAQQTEAEHAARIESRRERLRVGAGAVFSWLWFVLFGNVTIGVALVVVTTRRQQLLEWGYTQYARSGNDHMDQINRGLDIARLAPVWLLIAAGAIGALVLSRRATELAQLRAAQLVSLIGTVACPVLLPFGLIHAFRSRRRRLQGQPTRRRKLTVTGSLLACSMVTALVIDHDNRLFNKLVDAWPSGVRQWYVDTWPQNLQPWKLTQNIGVVAAVLLPMAAVGLWSAWLSYDAHRSVASETQFVGIASGGLAVVGGLPLIATLIAGVGVVIFWIAVVIFILWIAAIVLSGG